MSEPSTRLPPDFEQAWDSGWDEHERQQMLRMAKLPFSEKIKWLDEAHCIVLSLMASRQAQLKKTIDPSSGK